jgi:hypothetical protein
MLAIESGQKSKGEDVVGTLNRIKISHGAPKMVHCDNGSEFCKNHKNSVDDFAAVN